MAPIDKREVEEMIAKAVTQAKKEADKALNAEVRKMAEKIKQMEEERKQLEEQITGLKEEVNVLKGEWAASKDTKEEGKYMRPIRKPSRRKSPRRLPKPWNSRWRPPRRDGRQGMMDYMTLQLATRAIDELVFGRDQMCTIWADHYNNARRVARYYVFCGLSERSEVYGMFHCWSELDRYYEVDREAKRILEACYSRAQKIVEKNEVLIKELTDLLIDVKVVKKEDFWRLAEQHGNFQELPPLVVDIRRKKLEEFRERMIMEKRSVLP
ncbi:hypothetical protein L7F22_040783 [Adiantum nelumboides]|nr:hypothetical protein [Adiantum nelumboides]